MDPGLALAFVVGLLSTLHCVGMCGGIMGALTYALPDRVRGSPPAMLPFLLAYNVGRIVSYGVAGALAGALGSELLAAVGGAQGVHWPRWLAGAVMIGIGLHLAGWLPQLARVERLGLPLWQRLEPLGRRLLPVQTTLRALAFGAVWGWLPCGLVYTMLLTATTRSGAASGAAFMLAFGLGTVPTLLATGLLAGRLYRFPSAPVVQRVGGMAVALLGVMTVIFPLLWDVPAVAVE